MSEAFYQNFINIKLWDKAKWRAVAFIIDESYEKIPVLGLAYENGQVGKKIFRQWINRLGEVDEYGELRVAIIEGYILGREPGYSVHISSNPAKTMEKAKLQGIELRGDLVITGSRIHRMNPGPDSKNLELFKAAYQVKKAYLLAPVSLAEDRVKPHLEHGIVKSEIHFRHVDEFTENDFDSIIFL